MSEDFKNTVLGVVLATLVGAVAGLFKKVNSNGEAVLLHAAKLEALQIEVKRLDVAQVTQECVREVIEESLTKRDAAAQERREQWDENLTLRIEKAVVAGVRECQALTKAELERMVPRIVREVLTQTGRFDKHEGV